MFRTFSVWAALRPDFRVNALSFYKGSDVGAPSQTPLLPLSGGSNDTPRAVLDVPAPQFQSPYVAISCFARILEFPINSEHFEPTHGG